MHTTNVMSLALCFGLRLGCSYPEAKTLGLAAMLHDVGKLNTPNRILRSDHSLTDLEFHRMQRHTVSGHLILRRCNFGTNSIAVTALQHHEKQDGSGYPNGSTTSPRMSRIVSIIDAFEALTSDSRPYRDALQPYEALRLIKQEVRQGKFDKNLYRLFVGSLGHEV